MPSGQSRPPRVLIVGNNGPAEEAARLLANASYDVLRAGGRDEMLAARAQGLELVLFDSTLPDDAAFALCMEFSAGATTANIPILMLVPDDESVIERALGAGADDVVLLPLRRSLLRQRVVRLMKQTQTAGRLQERERLFHDLFDQKNIIRLLADPDTGAILEASSAACAFYGHTPEAFRRKKLSDLDAQPARQMMMRAIRATADQDTYLVYTHRLASGETREMEMYSSPLVYFGQRVVQILLHDISQRKQIEVRLRESEERYEKVLGYSNDVVFTVGKDTTITFLSGGFTSIVGLPPDEWIGRSFVPLIYFDDLPLALNMFDRVMRGEVPPPFEMRFNRSDGGFKYGEVIVHPQIENREVVALWGAVRDITKRREAEQAEREQRALAEALRDTAAALNGTLDRDELLGRILVQVARVVPGDTANVMLIDGGYGRVVRHRGYAERGLEKEVMQLRFPLALTPNMKYMVESGRPYVVADVDQYEGWVAAPGTSWIRSHIAAPITVNGKVIGFLNLDSAMVNTFSDLDAERLKAFADQAGTAIRNAELYEALREQTEALEQRVAERTAQLELERAQLRTILDSMNEGVIYDENFRVRYINRALTELTGYRFSEWTGYLDLLRSEEMTPVEFKRLTASIYEVVERGQDWSTEIKLRRKDGSEFDANVTCSQVLGANGEVIGSVTVIRDISQEKALQHQKERFVAFASHELRTPITNLKTRLYLMRRIPDRMEDHLQTLDEVTERMRRLVEDLLDTSRFERGVISLRRQMVGVQALVESVVRLQSPEGERKSVALSAELPDTPVEIFADPERIVQVITNLVVNAINYTPAQGSVTVRLMPVYVDEDGGAWTEILVEDNGVGIAPEHLPHIFQPFFRIDGRGEGTGLGLSITHQIVHLHGGEIRVDSEVGRGSTFRVRLPVAPIEPPELDVTAVQPKNALQPS